MDNIMDTKYKNVGLLASVLLIFAFSHLVVRVHYTKETQHLSYNWIFLILCGQGLYGFYGYVNNLYGIIIPSLCVTIGVLYILYIKLVHDKNESILYDLKEREILK